MLVPLSWLKDYVDISLKPKDLGDRLTEVGLGCEKIIKLPDDVVFELEITPNRPDWLSIIGVAYEIAAIEQKKITYPTLKTNLKPTVKTLPLKIQTDPKINPRFTGVIIQAVTVKDSPMWLKKRLQQIGQRSINTIVDITNYVMFELGNPIHAFDYDKISGHVMKVHQTRGGEVFKSVDGISYRLPKGAIVISDNEKVIDLCGIKGGQNTGTFANTKNVFIRVPVEIPILIRRASQSLGLRSEASAIFERGVNSGGTIDALRRCVDLILELSGGEIASELFDVERERFEPWSLSVRKERLQKILGIDIAEKQILSILQSLNLSPKISKDTIECIIPTYRNDLKIEEDLIEEVARLYGYNNFPKTLPTGKIPIEKVPYFKDYRLDEVVKNILKAAGFSECFTYSLVSETDLLENAINPDKTLRVDNPVSREFEYLRPTHKINLKKAVKQNMPNFKEANLFELGKVYVGKNIEDAKEPYFLSGISTILTFYEVKGILNRLFEELGIKKDPTEYIELLDEGVFFELNFSDLLTQVNLKKIFKPLPKYPPIIEDLALVVDEKVPSSDIINAMQKQSKLIVDVTILDRFKNTRTFHMLYQHKDRNLTTSEAKEVREKILKVLKEKFNAELKD